MATDLSVTVHGIGVRTGPTVAGRLGTANITASDGSDNVIYTVPNVTGMSYVIGSVSLCNRDSSTLSNVNIAISSSDTPADYEFIEWNASIVPNGVLERTQLMLAVGDRVIVRVGTP